MVFSSPCPLALAAEVRPRSQGVHLLVQLRLRHGFLGALAPLALSFGGPQDLISSAPRPHPRLHLYGSQVVLHSESRTAFTCRNFEVFGEEDIFFRKGKCWKCKINDEKKGPPVASSLLVLVAATRS